MGYRSETVSGDDKKIVSSARSFLLPFWNENKKALSTIFLELERRVARESGIHSHVSGIATICETPCLTVGRP